MFEDMYEVKLPYDCDYEMVKERLDWINKNTRQYCKWVTDITYTKCSTFYFHNSEDAFAFVMTWG